MQEKTIKSILKRKVDDWCNNIDDNSLKDIIKKNVIITGGSIVSLLSGEDVNDFDIYFKTHDATFQVSTYYVEKFKENPPSRFKNNENCKVNIFVKADEDRIKVVVKSQGIAGENGTDDYQYFEGVDDPSEPEKFVEGILKDKQEANAEEKEGKNKYRPVFVTTNAITLSNKIQIVIRFFGSPDVIHENFDFVHCTCYWDYDTNNLVLPNAALVSIINKRLKYKSSKYPLCSLIRTRKFIKRGWHIDAGQYLKMSWQLNALDLTNSDVLEDQLVGMDSAYFDQVIRMLSEYMKKNDKTSLKGIDDTFLMQVVDKVFG